MICRNCKKNKFLKLSNIGYQPISSIFLKNKEKIKNYSLDLFKCESCDLVQLSKIANLKDMYGPDYGYKTSVSKLMINHLREKFIRFKKLNILRKNSNILDIGSNDGTFLNFFVNKKNNLNYTNYPTSFPIERLDYPNNPLSPDIEINFS